MSILIVDDSADDRLLLQAILSAAGYENILTAESGPPRSGISAWTEANRMLRGSI